VADQDRSNNNVSCKLVFIHWNGWRFMKKQRNTQTSVWGKFASVLLGGLSLAFLEPVAIAQQDIGRTQDSGSLNDGNWSDENGPSGSPGSTDNAYIGFFDLGLGWAADGTVDLDADAEVSNLYLGDGRSFGILNINAGASLQANSLQLSSGSALNLSGTLGVLNLHTNGETINQDGALFADGVYMGWGGIETGFLRNSGTLTLNQLQLGGGAELSLNGLDTVSSIAIFENSLLTFQQLNGQMTGLDLQGLFIESGSNLNLLFDDVTGDGLDWGLRLAISINNLAVAYLATGKVDLALPLFEQTLAGRLEQLGADHPDTLLSMHNLAGAYAANEQTDQAFPLWEKTLDARTLVLGPGHPETIATMTSLARGYLENQRAAEAVPLLERAREHRLAESPELAAILTNMGSAAKRLDRIPQAVKLLREGVDIAVEQTPSEWTTFHEQSLLGESLVAQTLLLEQGDVRTQTFAEAEKLLIAGYEGLVERQASIAVPAGPKIVAAFDRLNRLYESWEKAEESQKYRRLRDELVSPQEL
jgi:tetratricopeptide (TPR) repeat protein